ncbi:MAG: InlB B-repeat-containing protein [Spirochaetaceae bacterium]|jgi:uncharacterized repeat protein (TIGR02543 family)|nr:InlB B-repeat-containing protein [Spirochaetaceae bacterium]
MVKKICWRLTAMAALTFGLVLAGCDNDTSGGGGGGEDENKTTKYTVTFNVNEGTSSLPLDQNITSGNKATKPTAIMTKDLYVFDGWYTGTESTDPRWNFNTGITSNITLYAKWVNNLVWTVTSSPVGTNDVKGIVWGGSMFVAAGAVGSIAYSTNGSTWTGTYSSVPGTLGGIVWGGGTFVVVGDAGSIAYYSTN